MKSKEEILKALDKIFIHINFIREKENPIDYDLVRISEEIFKIIEDYDMQPQDFLFWTYGYLHGLESSFQSIPEQLIIVKEMLHEIDVKRFPLLNSKGERDHLIRKDYSDDLRTPKFYDNDSDQIEFAF